MRAQVQDIEMEGDFLTQQWSEGQQDKEGQSQNECVSQSQLHG